MSTIAIRLPDSLHNEVRRLAHKEKVSINHLATLALAEKIAAFETEDYLIRRAARTNKKRFLRAMNKIANVKPEERDVL